MTSLVSLHTQGVMPMDWHAVATAPQPSPPPPVTASEQLARADLASYTPGFTDKLFGKAKRRVAELELAVEAARQDDARATQHALADHANAIQQWQYHQQLAQRMIARDTAAYHEVLDAWSITEGLSTLGAQTIIQRLEPNGIQYLVGIDAESNVPEIELRLTKTGKMSQKKMAVGKRWEVIQDHVCSAGLRLLSDSFALLCIDRVVVNVGGTAVNPATGHLEPVTWLALHATRGAFSQINPHAVDPSDSMVNFDARMQFRKTKGFTPVDPMSLDDQWVTT